MNNSIVSLLLIQIILIALNAVFASAELAVLSVNESKINRLAERGSKKARRLRKLLIIKAYGDTAGFAKRADFQRIVVNGRHGWRSTSSCPTPSFTAPMSMTRTSIYPPK